MKTADWEPMDRGAELRRGRIYQALRVMPVNAAEGLLGYEKLGKTPHSSPPCSDE